MAGQVEGKVAVVTGAGRGIGRAIAVVMAGEGARIVVSDIEVASGEETVRTIREAGGNAVFVRADVTREADQQMLVRETVEAFGRLDCAVNNAGIDGDTALTADCSKENWTRVIAINLTGVFLGLKCQIAQMLQQGGGAIVNIASTMGIVAHECVPAYVASKHGVVGLTRSTALGYVKENIRVNAVCPGNTRTAICDSLEKNWPEVYKELIAGMPIGRLAEPKEIARAVLWLCSDAASYVTGHAMVVDAGYSIH